MTPQTVMKATVALFSGTKKWGKQNPHMILVAAIFIILFTFNYITFISFFSLGFFFLLLTEHVGEHAQTWLKQRKARQEQVPPP